MDAVGRLNQVNLFRPPILTSLAVLKPLDLQGCTLYIGLVRAPALLIFVWFNLGSYQCFLKICGCTDTNGTRIDYTPD